MEANELQVSPGATMEMDDVTAVYEKLLGAVAPGKTLTVDLSEVEAFDTAGLQVLPALSRAAQGRGAAVVFVNPPENMRQAVRQLDLGKFLGEWPANEVTEEVGA